MATIGITKRILGMTKAQKTQKANERQSVARADGNFKDLDLEQDGKAPFSTSMIYLALALKSFDL